MLESTAPEDLEIERLARARRVGRGLLVAARRAIVLARRYRSEEGPGGLRERACVAQALAWRLAAREARELLERRPGLARTTTRVADANRRTG